MKPCRIETMTDPLEESGRRNFSWLLRIRWATISTLAFLLVSAKPVYDLTLPPWLIISVVGLGVLSNLFLHRLLKRGSAIPCPLPTLTLCLDLVLLTVIHFHLVSAFTPFTTLYIIYISLGAFLLNRKCSYILTVFAILCYFSYFCFGGSILPNEALLREHATLLSQPEALDFLTNRMEVYLKNFHYFMFVILFLTAILIVVPVGTIKSELEKHKMELQELENEKRRGERLATLTTFAAGAAHELATPLSTIAVVAGDMPARIKETGGDPELMDDAGLIRDQVQRAKDILSQMSADCGAELGAKAEEFRLKELIKEVLNLFYLKHLRINISFYNKVGNLHVTMPGRTLTRSVHSLIKNAVDASAPGGIVRISCEEKNGFLFIEVEDQGHGMEKKVLNKAAEPFFTTKEPGSGMGLGLFLAKTMADKFGGDLTLESEPGAGTTATLYFALDRINAFHPEAGDKEAAK